jgi:hypothetical protein
MCGLNRACCSAFLLNRGLKRLYGVLRTSELHPVIYQQLDKLIDRVFVMTDGA